MINFEKTLPSKIESTKYIDLEYYKPDSWDLVEIDEDGDYLGDNRYFFEEVLEELIEEICASEDELVTLKYINRKDSTFGTIKVIQNLKASAPISLTTAMK